MQRPTAARTPLSACVVVLPLLVAACVSIETQHRDWSDYDGPGKQYFLEEEPPFVEMSRDPGEPANRIGADVNEWFLYWVMQPIGTGWRTVFRDWGTERISNFANNLAWPVRLLNSLFQGDWSGAWGETKRFAVNTTAGVLGFWDRAADWEIGRSDDEDTGQSLGKAGWEDPTFLHIPGIGPTNTRDAVGYVGDQAMNPATWLFPLNIVLMLNDQSRSVQSNLRFFRTNQDPYLMSRYLSEIHRSSKLEDYDYSPPDDSAANETLRAVFLQPRDDDFPWEAETGRAHIPATGEKLPYTYRLQRGKAPIVFVLPGLGSHREGSGTLALCEIVWDRGFSFATISSTFNFEFMRHASTAELPGFPGFDIPDAHAALDAVHRDLEQRFPGRMTGKALLGLSMGAFQTLGIASAENLPDYPKDRVTFDRYLALDAPINLIVGMRELDDFYQAPMQWPANDRYERTRDTIWKTMALASGEITPGKELPFTELEARYLIGLTFRIGLAQVIFDSQLRNNRGVLLTELDASQPTPAYREILEYGYMEYMYAFVLPWLLEVHDDIESEADMLERTDLRMVGRYLKANENVWLMANEDDFLTTPEDRDWIEQLLGADRVLFHLAGGHIGNLYKPEIQGLVTIPLEDLLPAGGE